MFSYDARAWSAVVKCVGGQVLRSGRTSLIVLRASDGILMARVQCLSAAAVMALAAILPANAGDPTGTWLIEDGTARVRIVACGEAMCGTVVWLEHPIDATTGKPQTDKLNADPEKRSRPMLGVAVVLGMQRYDENNKWSGKIYNPDDGGTYQGSIELVNPTQLRVKGCVVIFCRAEIWTLSD